MSLTNSMIFPQRKQAMWMILANGVVRHGMPVWSELPEPQRWQLVSYLSSLVPAGKSP
jgi:hypothetical protein